MAGVIVLLCVIKLMSSSNSEKWLKSVYIYASYRKIKTGIRLFGPLRGCKTWQHTDGNIARAATNTYHGS